MFRMLLKSLQGLFKVCTCIKLRKNWTVCNLHLQQHFTVAANAAAVRHSAVQDVIYLSSVVKIAVNLFFFFICSWYVMFPVFAVSVLFFSNLCQTANQK